MPDHIHLLARLRQDKTVSNLLRDIKANSSGFIHRTFPELRDFFWQGGYSAFTVSQSQVERVRNYIANQKEHRVRKSFHDELKALLKAHGIEYDDAHLLD